MIKKEFNLSEKIITFCWARFWFDSDKQVKKDGHQEKAIKTKDVKEFIKRLNALELQLNNPVSKLDKEYNSGMQSALKIFKREMNKLAGEELK